MANRANIRPEFSLLDTDTKEWIDARTSWILYQFGWDRIRSRSIILPTAEFFPNPQPKSEDDVLEILYRFCATQKISQHDIDLWLLDHDGRINGAEQVDEDLDDDRFPIYVDISELQDPLGLAYTLTYQLCRMELVGRGRISESEDDLNPLTDLLSVFLGFGVISSNATLQHENWSFGEMHGVRFKARGSLTMQMYGYALALFSKIRSEDTAQWATSLRPDVRQAFHQSLQFVTQFGLPELRSLRTTSARPTHLEFENTTHQLTEDDIVEFDDHSCAFCGAEIPENQHLDEEYQVDICQECQQSIEENQAEIAAESQASELAWLRRLTVFTILCRVAAIVIVVMTILQWLGIIK